MHTANRALQCWPTRACGVTCLFTEGTGTEEWQGDGPGRKPGLPCTGGGLSISPHSWLHRALKQAQHLKLILKTIFLSFHHPRSSLGFSSIGEPHAQWRKETELEQDMLGCWTAGHCSYPTTFTCRNQHSEGTFNTNVITSFILRRSIKINQPTN